MGKKSPPPAPDYRGAAQEQSDASQTIATGQTYADRPNVTTPWGTQTWTPSVTIDPATGKEVTSWNQNIALDPEQQQALDAQMRLGLGRTNAAEGLLGQAVSGFEKPMDWSSLPGRAGSIDAPTLGSNDINPDVINKAFSFGGGVQRGLEGDAAAYRDRAADAVRQLQAPGLKQRRESSENQLVNQGFARGSEAYTNAMRDVSDAESRADLMAIGAGRDEANAMFGQDLQAGEFVNRAQGQEFQQGAASDQFENAAQQQEFENIFRLAQQGDTRAQQQLAMQMQAGGFNNQNRSQAISEEQLRRGMSLNELNALLTGQQVGMPNIGGSAPGAKGGQAADILSAATAQGQGEMAAWQQQSQQQGATNSALASTAIMAMMYY